MPIQTLPPGVESSVEKIFTALAKALRVYELGDITVQESGFVSGRFGRMWAEGRIRNDLSSGITLKVGSGAAKVRRAVYEQVGRPWYSSIWRLDSTGQRSWEWDFDSRPRYSGPLSNCLETYLEDLAAFPRPDHLVPVWMRPTRAAAGAWDPTTDRLTLDQHGQPAGVPAHLDEPECWYLLPLADSPTGPRRAFGHLPPDLDERDADLPLAGPTG